MQELLDTTKTAAGRQELLSSGRLAQAAAGAASLLSTWSSKDAVPPIDGLQNLLLLLRLLRNSCALGVAAAAVLLQHNLQDLVTQFASQIALDCNNQNGSNQGLLLPVVAKTTPPQQQLNSHAQEQQQLLQLTLAAVQLLSNLSATGPEAATALWAVLFPAHLCSILQVDEGRVHEALALTALSCTRSSTNARQDLCSPAAAAIWLQLLAPLMPGAADTPPQQDTPTSSKPAQAAGLDNHTQQEATVASELPSVNDTAGVSTTTAAVIPAGNDNLCLLIKCLAMQHNHLQQLMELLGPTAAAAAEAACASTTTQGQPAAPAAVPNLSNFTATERHAVLLHVVALEAAAVPAACPLPGICAAKPSTERQQHEQQQQPEHQELDGPAAAGSWLQYVVSLLQVVWDQALAAAAPTAGVCSQPTATAHVLEAALEVLKAALARDEDTAEASTAAGSKAAEAAAAAGLAAVAQYLHRAGLLEQLLKMLKALGPPPKTKQQQQRELEQQQLHQQQQQQQGSAQPSDCPAAPLEQPQAVHQQPYCGYRADVVAVLSNMLLGAQEVAAAVMACGGIELLLNNCNLDESSPLAREWALWGIRNACKDNEAVQGYVAQFQAVDAVQSTELDRMGMQLELDQLTHKLKMVKKPGAGQ